MTVDTPYRWARRTALATLTAAGLAAVGASSAWAGEGLTVFEWSGYEDPEIHKPYIEKYGGSPEYAFFGDEEEAFQKVRQGFKADLIHPCAQSLQKWQDAGLFKPIDKSRIEKWDQLMPELRELPFVQRDGKLWMVPADWGNTGLTYRTDLVSEEEASTLQIFTNEKFKGKVSIGDNVDDAYALAFLATGVKDWTKATDEQFKAASDWLRKVHPNVRFYWSDYSTLIQAMASGEIEVAWSWNDTPTKLAEQGISAKMNKDAKEGVSTWVCGFAFLANGEGSEDKAYDYINAFLSDQSAQYLLTAWGYGHANKKAFDEAGAEALETAGFANFEKVLANSLFQIPPSPEMREKMIAEFEKIKAGH